MHDAGRRVKAELARVIVGQADVVDQALTALFAGGNCLLVGVPGLAKTLLIQSMARALDLRFSRIQFTPSTGSAASWPAPSSEEHTSELQSRENLVCRLLLETYTSND